MFTCSTAIHFGWNTCNHRAIKENYVLSNFDPLIVRGRLVLRVEKIAHLLLEQFVSPRINSYAYKNGNEYKFSDLHELVFSPQQTLLIPRVKTRVESLLGSFSPV